MWSSSWVTSHLKRLSFTGFTEVAAELWWENDVATKPWRKKNVCVCVCSKRYEFRADTCCNVFFSNLKGFRIRGLHLTWSKISVPGKKFKGTAIASAAKITWIHSSSGLICRWVKLFNEASLSLQQYVTCSFTSSVSISDGLDQYFGVSVVIIYRLQCARKDVYQQIGTTGKISFISIW